ncbi:hypothetical protein [Streptomyces mashuensis]|nr:hypothetical protein [Streptomyces mashuensis]
MGDDHVYGRDVLDELGHDRIEELARDLRTDVETARQVVLLTVAALPADLRAGGAGGGVMSTLFDQVAVPVQATVAARTGLSERAVGRALELLLPVIMTTIAKKRRG